MALGVAALRHYTETMPSKDAGDPSHSCDGLHEVIVRLPDALPRKCLENWHHEVERCMNRARQAKHRDLLPPEEAEIAGRNVGRIQRYLDQRHGSPLLERDGVAEIVSEVVCGGTGDAYHLVDFRVGSTYFVARLAPQAGVSVEAIVAGWKSETTRRINSKLGRKGTLWHPHVIHRDLGG